MNGMQRLSDYFYASAQPVRTALLLAIVAGFFWTFNFSGLPISAPSLRAFAGGEPMLDLRLSYSPDEAYHLMLRLGETGRAAYLKFLGLDFVFLLVYGSGFAFLMSWLLRHASWDRGRLHYANLLPLGVALADALENCATFAQLLVYPHPLPLVASLGGAFTLAKQLGVVLSLTAMLWAAGVVLKRRLTG
jgi:hypothetical protein